MPNETILIIEDDSMNMKLTRYILELEGYCVLEASTAGEAIEKINAIPPDLILMDVHLPDMDGLSVVRKIRETTAGKDIIILALTACAMIGDRERILKMGCDGYISKPINIHSFTKTLRDFLNPKEGHK